MSRRSQWTPDAGAMDLGTVDLLPKRFREKRRVYRTLCVWFALTLTSLAVLAITVAAFWAHAKRIESRQSQLLADAAPLWQVRADVVRMREEIDPLRKSCFLVESAKPRDELVQSLAAITVASQDPEGNILVDSVEVHLPLEYGSNEDARPHWARPALSVTAIGVDNPTSTRWLDRMNASDRIVDGVIDSRHVGSRQSKTAITATPITIGDLP